MSAKSPSPDIVFPGKDIQTVNSVSHLESRFDTPEGRAELANTLSRLSINSLALAKGVNIPTEGSPDIYLTGVDQLAMGRERSQHGVQFGQLVIEGGDNSKTSELVAVKYQTPEKAAHEYLTAQYIDKQLGRSATFQTIGFVKHPNERHVGLVSRYDHSVVSLDNTLYDPESTPESVTAAAVIAAKYLATMHGDALQLVHGDAQPKNIAVDSQKNPFFVDLESTRNVRMNALGNVVPIPQMNKFMDISDFVGVAHDGNSWKLSLDTADAFVETYMTHQSGGNPVTADDVFSLLSPHIEELKDF